MRQVQGSAAVDQADAPDIDRLLADIDAARADIHIRIADRGHELRQRDPIGLQLVEVRLDLVFLRGSAPGIDLHHAGHGEQAALQDPVLDGPEIGQAEMRRAFYLIAVNLAHHAGGLNLRLDVVRKVDVLLKVEADLLEREIIVDAVVERHADKGQPVEGGRADIVYARRGGNADLDWNGVEALHLLRRQASRLGRDLDDDRRRIGVCLDIELREREGARDDEARQQQQRDGAARQPECDKALKHALPPACAALAAGRPDAGQR